MCLEGKYPVTRSEACVVAQRSLIRLTDSSLIYTRWTDGQADGRRCVMCPRAIVRRALDRKTSSVAAQHSTPAAFDNATAHCRLRPRHPSSMDSSSLGARRRLRYEMLV